MVSVSASGSLGHRLAVGQRTLEASLRYETLGNLLNRFLSSRRQGLSPRTLKFYKGYLTRAALVFGPDVTGQDISNFLNSLLCSNGGKHSYFRALRAFYNWFYSPRSGYGLSPQDNPMLIVDAPKVESRILPSVTEEQIDSLLKLTDNLRDQCIISLLADSGMRLSELTNIGAADFDWHNCTVKIWGKGNKQRKAPFTKNTRSMLQLYLTDNHANNSNVWGLNQYGIQKMLKRLTCSTGIKCNPHAFRRGFACNLHRKRLSTLDIMHLGGWQDLSMVLRYTRSITFEDCLKHYREVEQPASRIT